MMSTDPNRIGQFDARTLNIESKVEQRFDATEKRFDDFVECCEHMLIRIAPL